MIKLSVFSTVLALICLGAANGDEIIHTRLDSAHMVTTSSTHFAIANAVALGRFQWKTVVVNGNEVLITRPDCGFVTKTMLTLSEKQKNAISSTKNNLDLVKSTITLGSVSNTVYERFSSDGFQVKEHTSSQVQDTPIEFGDMSITQYDEENFSISKTNMPNNLARIFLTNNIVIYTYKDGRIHMAPKKCLSSSDMALLRWYIDEKAEAERQRSEESAKTAADMAVAANIMTGSQSYMEEQNYQTQQYQEELERQMQGQIQQQMQLVQQMHQNLLSTGLEDYDDNSNGSQILIRPQPQLGYSQYNEQLQPQLQPQLNLDLQPPYSHQQGLLDTDTSWVSQVNDNFFTPLPTTNNGYDPSSSYNIYPPQAYPQHQNQQNQQEQFTTEDPISAYGFPSGRFPF